MAQFRRKITNKREINEINLNIFLYPSGSDFEASASKLRLSERKYSYRSLRSFKLKFERRRGRERKRERSGKVGNSAPFSG